AAKAGDDPMWERRGWSFGAAGCAVGVPAFHAAERGAGNACLLAAESIPSRLEGSSNPAWRQAVDGERERQVPLLRDIFGNPSRPVTLDPAWLTPTATMLAQAAYDERTLPEGTLKPDRLAVL